MTDPTWTYHNPVRILFQRGALDRLGEFVEDHRVVLVTTPGFRKRGVVDRIEKILGNRLAGVFDQVKPNPDLSDVDIQGADLRPRAPDLLIAVGGGSSMDTAKGLARLLSQPSDRSLTAHFREDQPFDQVSALPMIAVPTTSGTGAEVTPFGTLWDFERGKKYSVSGEDLYPRMAVLDPELTVALPGAVTIASGLDAVSHALESTWNKSANPVTLGLAAKSLHLSLQALPELKINPGDVSARGRMMQASLLAGLAISQTRTALSHSISYPLTTRFGLPHGLACSFTLPAMMRFNAAEDDGRLHDLACSVGYTDVASFSRGIESLFRDLAVSDLVTSYIPAKADIMALSGRMITPGRAGNNLRAADSEQIRQIVSESLDALKIE